MAWPEMFTRGGWVLLVGATYVSQPDGQPRYNFLLVQEAVLAIRRGYLGLDCIKEN